MSDDNNLPKPINIVIGITTSLITFISAIVGFVLLWRGNSEVVSTVVIVVSILGLWGSLFYIKFAKKQISSKKETEEQKGHKRKHKKTEKNVFAFSPKIRRFSTYGIIALPLIALFAWGIYYYSTNKPPKDVVVLILEFDGPEPQKNGVTQFFVEKISQITKGINYVEIITSNQIISSRDGYITANKLGIQNNANIVVWGWYVATEQGINVTYHVTEIQKNYGLGYEGVFDTPYNLNAEKERTETFEFQSNELTDNIVMDTLTSISGKLFEANQFDKSNDFLKIAIDYLEAHKGSFDVYEAFKSSLISSRAVTYAASGNLNKAIDEANMAVDLYPSASSYSNRGIILSNAGDYDGAIQDFLKAKSDAPEFFIAYSSLAKIYIQTGENDKAIAELTEGIETISCTLENGCLNLYYLRGQTYILIGQTEKAKADFEVIKSLVDDPEVSKILDAYLKTAQ